MQLWWWMKGECRWDRCYIHLQQHWFLLNKSPIFILNIKIVFYETKIAVLGNRIYEKLPEWQLVTHKRGALDDDFNLCGIITAVRWSTASAPWTQWPQNYCWGSVNVTAHNWFKMWWWWSWSVESTQRLPHCSSGWLPCNLCSSAQGEQMIWRNVLWYLGCADQSWLMNLRGTVHTDP